MRAVKLSGKVEALVSIVVNFLDDERFIEEAIVSILAQSDGNWELLLVDGSSDGSTEIALRYAERHPGKVRYLQHAAHRNRGMSASRNLGIRHARGEYVAFLDADDVWLPEKLKQQVAILDDSRPQAGMVVGQSKYWHGWTGNPEDSRRDYIPRFSVRSNSLVKPPAMVKLFCPLGAGPAPCPSSLLVRREIIEDTGGFEEDFQGIYSMYEDQAFLAKVYLKTAVFVAGQCWVKYREHPDSCAATVTWTGQYFCAQFILRWLTTYFVEQGVADTERWLALQEALDQCAYLANLEEGVKIVDILFPKGDSKPLWGYNVETSQPGSSINNHAVDISGWALGRSGLTAEVEVIREGILLQRVPIDVPRPDVAAAFPEIQGAEQSGFRIAVGVPSTSVWELGVRAVLRDQGSALLGVIQGHCR